MLCAIEVENVTKEYRGLHALKGVSFTLGGGEVFGLLGPNGAGKTTMVNIICAQLIPTSGRTVVCGIDCVREPRSVRALVGVAPSNARSLYWKLTGEENLLRFAALYYLSAREAKRRAERNLELFGLGCDARRLVSDYSTGMRAKLLLARALMHDPPVLILDEPWATLDPEARIEITGFLRRIADAEKKAILVCSHDLPLVEKICDSVAILEQGQIVCAGTTADLLDRLPYRFVIAAELPDSEQATALGAELGGVLGFVSVQGRSLRAEADQLLPAITAIESAGAGERLSYSVRRSSLEDVYLSAIRSGQGGIV